MTKSGFMKWVQLLLFLAILSSVYLTNLYGLSIASKNGFPVVLGQTIAIFGLPGLIALAWFALRHKFDYSNARSSLIIWAVGEGLMFFSSYTVFNFQQGP